METKRSRQPRALVDGLGLESLLAQEDDGGKEYIQTLSEGQKQEISSIVTTMLLFLTGEAALSENIWVKPDEAEEIEEMIGYVTSSTVGIVWRAHKLGIINRENLRQFLRIVWGPKLRELEKVSKELKIGPLSELAKETDEQTS